MSDSPPVQPIFTILIRLLRLGRTTVQFFHKSGRNSCREIGNGDPYGIEIWIKTPQRSPGSGRGLTTPVVPRSVPLSRSAVQSCPERATLATKDGLQQLEAMTDLPSSPRYWRLISIEGSARLAKRVNQSYQINPCVGPSCFTAVFQLRHPRSTASSRIQGSTSCSEKSDRLTRLSEARPRLILEGVAGVLPLILRRNNREHVPMLGNLAVFDSKKIVVRRGRFRACFD